MQKENGNLIFEEKVEQHLKWYPERTTAWGIFWYCSFGNIFTDNGTKIPVYKYLSYPHRVIKGKEQWKDSEVENCPPDIKQFLTRGDLKTNCFGYVFGNNESWIESHIEIGEPHKNTIDKILENDGYEKIEKPEVNSVAVFIENGKYTHAAKTIDGKIWLSKSGIHPEGEVSLEDEISDFGKPKYFKRFRN